MDNSRGPSSKRRNKPQDQQTQETRTVERPGSSRGYQNGDPYPASVPASSRGPLERLAHLARIIETFTPDISTIETEFGRELERERDIERLNHTVETLESSKWEELERLKRENVSLKAEQEACKQEKEKCQTIEAKLRSQSEETDARRKQEHEKKVQEDKVKSQKQLDARRAELEAEIKAKVRDAENESKKLSAEKKKLSAENDNLKTSLSEVREELKTENRKNTLAFKGLEDERASLQKELEEVKFEFPVEGKPVEYYLHNFQDICKGIQATSSRYFQKPPDHADTEAVYQSLRKKNPIFNSISLLDTESASFVRVGMARHIISSSLCDHIWQSFLTKTEDSGHAALNQLLDEVSQCLAASKGHGESVWRALTLRGIDAIANSSSKRRQADVVLEEVIGVLDPLISIEELDRFKEDLSKLITLAISIWELARKDEHRINIRRQPDPNNKTNWHADEKDIPQNSSLRAAETTVDPTLTPLCLFPHISQTNSQEGKKVLIHHGTALFPSSYVWAQAISERKEHEEEVERAVQEARSKANQRRPSVPASPVSGFMMLNKHEFR